MKRSGLMIFAAMLILGGSLLAANRADDSLNCKEILDCISECKNDEACENGCMDQGTTDALMKVFGVAGCAKQKCKDSENSEECINKECAAELKVCYQSADNDAAEDNSDKTDETKDETPDTTADDSQDEKTVDVDVNEPTDTDTGSEETSKSSDGGCSLVLF